MKPSSLLSMEDVRNYLRESDSIGDAERILLNNLQKSALNRQQRSALGPTSEMKESTSSYRPDVLKISDLLRSVDETEKRRKLEEVQKLQSKEEVPNVSPPPSLPVNPKEIDLYADEEIFKLEQLKLKIKRDAEDRKLAYERQRAVEEKAFREKHPEIGTLSETKAQELKRQLQTMQDEYNLKSAQQKANIVIAQRELEAMQSRALPYQQSSIIKATLPATARLTDDGFSKDDPMRVSMDDDSNDRRKTRVDNILSKIADPQFLEEKKQRIQSLRNREEQESKHVEAAQAWLKEDMARPLTSRQPIAANSLDTLPILQVSSSPTQAPSRNQPRAYNNNSNQSSSSYGEPFVPQPNPQQQLQQFPQPHASNPFFSNPQQQPMQQQQYPAYQQPSYQSPFYQPQPPLMRPAVDPTLMQYQRMAEQMEAENQARMSQLQSLLQSPDSFGNNNPEGNIQQRGIMQPQRGSYDPNKDFPYPLRRDTFDPKQEINNDKNGNNKDKPSKAELQRQEELSVLQHDLEKLKRQQELDEFKADYQRRSLARSKQIEYETWLEDNKRELQRLKMQQVIAKEKKLLDLAQNVTSSLPENSEDVSRLKEECGVGLSTIPLSLASGLSVFVDGLSFASSSKREGLLYRIALGLYDSSGKGVGKLTASSWDTWSQSGSAGMEVLPSTLFRSLSANEWNNMKENKAGLRALIELQVKDNDNNSTARGIGWSSILLFTSSNGDELAVNNNCWAITLRKGLSDPAADPLSPISSTSDRSSNNNGDKFLVRIIENRGINRATAWSLAAAMTMASLPALLTLYTDYLKAAAAVPQLSQTSPSKPGTTSMKSSSARLLPSSSLSSRPNSSQPQQPMTTQQSPDKPPQNSKSARPFTSSSTKASPSSSASTRNNVANNGINSTTTLPPPILPKVDESVEEADESPRAALNTSTANLKKQATDASQFWSLGPALGPPTERYQRGDGIDIYLDSARYLPDNVTITRLSLRIFNSAKEQIGHVFECICDPRSPAYHPRYNFKAELRANAINATAIALVRVDTLDASNLQAVCVGYTAIKLFAFRDRTQPTQASEPNVFINTGAFQLRLYAGRISPSLPSFNDSSILEGLKAIPCAIFLLRIQEAPKSTDGFNTLSKDDVPRDDWQKSNLMQPALEYAQYNGAATEPSDLELMAYEAKAAVLGSVNSISAEAALLQAMESGRIEHSLPSRPKAASSSSNTAALTASVVSKRVSSQVDNSVALSWTLSAAEINDQILLKSLFANNSNDEQQTLLTWWKSLMPALEALRRTLDYSLAAPYSVEGGLAINIVGLYNLPQDRIFPQFNSNKANAGVLSGLFSSTQTIDVNKNNALYIPKVIYSLAPPGLFYGEPPVHDSVHFTRSLDTVNSTVKAPRFRDGFAQFAPAEMAANLYLVVDVRFVKVELPDPKAAAATATADSNTNAKQKTSSGIDVSIENRSKNYWTIIPIAREKVPGQGYRYVQSGYFQAPLIEGPMPRNVLSSGANSNGILNSGNPYRELCLRLRNNAATAASNQNRKKAGGAADVLSDKQLKMSDGASILVQIYNPLVKDLVLPGITAMAEAGGDGPEAQYTTQLVLCAAEGVTGPSTARVERYLYQSSRAPQVVDNAASKASPSDKSIGSMLPTPLMGPAGGVAPGTSPDVAASHEAVLKLANEVFATATGLENTSL